MKFKPTMLEGAWLIGTEPFADHRGSFARTFCSDEFRAHGLQTDFCQHSLAITRHRGTVRGLHFQTPPHQEVKLVRCVAGAVFDVIVDLRPDSSTYRQWYGVELSAANQMQLYVPEGFAHGCQTLTDDAAMLYLISKPYAPAAASGVRFDDPAFAIDWPMPAEQLSQRDRSWPLLT